MRHVLPTPGHALLVEDVERAENCHLFDRAGRRYVDLESGVWCTSIGHAHPRVLAVLRDQSARIAHAGFGYSAAVVEEAAAELLALAGLEDGACVFLCSGSEAVEYGVRVMRQVASAPLLMTLSDSYFGAYGAASTRHEGAWYELDWLDCPRCSHPSVARGGCEHRAGIPFDRIGGFLFEPGSSSGLVRFPPQAVIEDIDAGVRERDGFLMVNEVTTGIGRTGRWFGYQHYGVEPDIVALGKGIGNGYPVSATLVSARVLALLGDEPVHYAQSHQNDPLGAAVAREVVRVIEGEDLIARGAEIGARLLAGLRELVAARSRVRAVRGRGPMVAVDLDDGPDAAFTGAVHRALAAAGYLVGRRPQLNVLRLDPALTIDPADIEGFIAAFAEIVRRG